LLLAASHTPRRSEMALHLDFPRFPVPHLVSICFSLLFLCCELPPITGRIPTFLLIASFLSRRCCSHMIALDRQHLLFACRYGVNLRPHSISSGLTVATPYWHCRFSPRLPHRVTPTRPYRRRNFPKMEHHSLLPGIYFLVPSGFYFFYFHCVRFCIVLTPARSRFFCIRSVIYVPPHCRVLTLFFVSFFFFAFVAPQLCGCCFSFVPYLTSRGPETSFRCESLRIDPSSSTLLPSGTLPLHLTCARCISMTGFLLAFLSSSVWFYSLTSPGL